MSSNFTKSLSIILMVVVRILTLLFVLKFLAYNFGVFGFGFLTQVMAIGASFSSFAGGGIANGLVREVASSKSIDEQTTWLKASLWISIFSALILMLINVGLYFFASQWIFGDTKYNWIFLLIGLAQIGTGIGLVCQSYLAAIGKVYSVSASGILGVFASAFLVVSGTWIFGLNGAAAGSAILGFSPSFLAMLLLLKAMNWRVHLHDFQVISYQKIRTLLRYGIALIVTALAVPLVLLVIRSTVAQKFGWEEVGYWQAIARIGDAYFQVFGAWLVSIFLPRISALPPEASVRVMLRMLTPMMVTFVFGGLVLWQFAPQILSLVYSSAFERSSIYVLPQLLGDFFRITASVLVYRFIAYGKPHVQIISELGQASVLYLAFVILFAEFGAFAPVLAHVFASVFGFIVAALLTLLYQPYMSKH